MSTDTYSSSFNPDAPRQKIGDLGLYYMASHPIVHLPLCQVEGARGETKTDQNTASERKTGCDYFKTGFDGYSQDAFTNIGKQMKREQYTMLSKRQTRPFCLAARCSSLLWFS